MSTIAESTQSNIPETKEERAPAIKYIVRHADLEKDRDAIIGLWERNLTNDWTDAARFEHFYLRGFFAKGRCIVMETDPGGEIVGVHGSTITMVQVGDKYVPTRVMSDLAVDENHRSAFTILRMVKMNVPLNEEADIICGIGNDKSDWINKRMCDMGTTLDRWSRTLRSKESLQNRKATSKFAPVLAPFVDLALWFTAPETRIPLRGHRLERFFECDTRFDALWEEARTHLGLVSLRNAAFLKWRYIDCKRADYSLVGLLTPDGKRLRGYAAYYITKGQARCVDFLAADPEESLQLLFAALLRRVRREGATTISLRMSGPEAVKRALQAMGLRNRETGEGTVIFRAKHRLGESPTELDVKNWYIQLGDKDRE